MVDRQAGPEATRSRGRLLLVVLILAAALVLGAAFRIDSMRHKRGLHVDEVWSYVSAAGDIGHFVPTGSPRLVGAWEPASSWRARLGPGPVFDFAQIDSGLAHHDVHPPLYFFALHVWTLIVGMKFWSGPSLNLLIDLLTGAALFGLARRLLRDDVAAALVVLIWAVSPAVRLVSSMARMYTLEALFCVLFIWALVALADPKRAPARPLLGAALLALATAGGMLSQYQFALIVVGGAAYVLIALARVDRRRCVRALLALAVGMALVPLVQPGVFVQWQRQSERRSPWPFTVPFLVRKIDRAADTLVQFFGAGQRSFDSLPARPLRLWGLLPGTSLSNLAMVCFWACVAVAIALAVPRSRRWLVRRDWRGGLALIFLVWVAGTIIAQNFAFFSEPKLLSARYLAVAWPLLAFLPVVLARAFLPRWPNLIVAVLCLGVMVPFSRAPVNIAASAGPVARLSAAPRVIIDRPDQASIAPIALTLPNDAQVYADRPRDMGERPGTWLDGLHAGDFFVHDSDVSVSALRLLQARYVVRPLSPPYLRVSDSEALHVYRIVSARPTERG